MTCFDQAPEFIDEDNRRFRGRNPVSKNQMLNKHEALLPADFVKGKTILDLGCCLGATGHWCLSHGAAHYTGVEFQGAYVEIARKLFGKYHPGKFSIEQTAIEQWLAQPRSEQFDIVCMLGVIYVFTDYYSILKACARLSRECFAIEGLYPGGKLQDKAFCGVQFIDQQSINLADANAQALGRAARVSPKGMQWLMAEFGFSSPDGLLYPRPITDVPDIYNRPLNPAARLPVRYLMRFTRAADAVRNLSEDLQRGVMKKEEW